MIKKILLFLFLLPWFFCFGQRNYTTYTEENGLPSSRIYRMIQDLEGNMWFATSRGLTKFDGAKFRTFTYKDGLSNQDVWDLFVDAKNRVWFFSKSKFQGYVFKDRVHIFPNDQGINLSPSTFFATKNRMILYQSGFQWFELQDSVFVKKDIHIPKELSRIGFLVNPFLKSIMIVNKNSYDFVTLQSLQSAQYSSARYLTNNYFKGGSIGENTCYFINEKGIDIFDFKRKKAWSLSSKDFFKTEKLPMAVKFDFLNGKMLLSGAGHQYVLDNDFNILSHRDFSGIFPDNIQIYEDREGNLWFNNQSGLVFSSAENQQAKHFVNDQFIGEMEVIGGDLYAGGSKGILYQYNPQKDDFEVEINAGNFINLIIPEEKTVVTESEILQHKNGNWKALPFSFLSDNSNRHYKNFIRFKDRYFLFSGNTVYVLDDALRMRKQMLNGSNFSRAVVFQNHLLIGGTNGVFILRNQEIRPLFSEKFNYPVTAFAQMGNHLFIGTAGRGIFVFDGKYLWPISSTDGLNITRIRRDEKEPDILWFSSHRGVKKMKLQGKNFVQSTIVDAYTKDDGLSTNNVMDFIFKDHFLFAASDFGISRIRYKDPLLYKKVPVEFNVADTLRLPPNQRNNVRIEVLPRSFSRSASTELFYRFLPEQKKWTKLDSKEIIFNSLSPGTFTLEVQSVTAHQMKSISKIVMIVEPLWWEKTWVRWCFAIVFSGLVVLVFSLFYRRFKMRFREKMENKSRLASLELQALRSQMNPHFVHNSLNAIQYYIQRNDVELSENYLTRFSRLVRMFFDYSEKQTITLQEEMALLENYLQIEKMRFEDKFSYKIHCDEILMKENPQIPSMILQPILENAVNHGVFHRKENGKIEVSFTKPNQTTIEIKIEDNGIGYKKSLEMNRKHPSKRSSTVLKTRIKLLNESDIPITHEIIDKGDRGNGGEGTLVIITIKIPSKP